MSNCALRAAVFIAGSSESVWRIGVMNDFWKEGVMIRWALIGPPVSGQPAHLNTTSRQYLFWNRQRRHVSPPSDYTSVWCCKQGPPRLFLTPVRLSYVTSPGATLQLQTHRRRVWFCPFSNLHRGAGLTGEACLFSKQAPLLKSDALFTRVWPWIVSYKLLTQLWEKKNKQTNKKTNNERKLRTPTLRRDLGPAEGEPVAVLWHEGSVRAPQMDNQSNFQK